ncbi:hypothetical protein B1A_01660, partial [mine drainage metagenome]
ARTWSYRQAAREVKCCAAGTGRPGYGARASCGPHAGEPPGVLLSLAGLNALGVSVVPMSSEWRRAELEYLVGHSEICVAVVPEGRERELRCAA